MSSQINNSNEEFKNVTISFSGKNIKTCLILAIESFLYFYPNLKDNIIVFDDNSTDGTKEWLEQKHIKMITWKYYKHLLSKDIPGKNLNHTKRISLMNSEIMIQTNTKYLLINDSDVVFLRSGFIEQYLNLVNECDYSCLVHKQYKPIKHEIKQHFPKYLKYTKKIKIMIVLFKFIHFIYLWI